MLLLYHMNKFLPHLPLMALVFGLLIVQISQHGQTTSLMSNSVSGNSEEKIVEICTKPASFSSQEESAWCNTGLVSDIEEHRHSWKWSCLVGEKQHTCYFTENVSFPTRGGTLFTK